MSHPAVADELRKHVGKELKPISQPEAVNFVPNLPKTWSGKIMRWVLKVRAFSLPQGNKSMVEE